MSSSKFIYFGYGSNLLERRIRMNSPSAVRITCAKLKDYRLDFGYWSRNWNGSVATIVPDVGEEVWGAVWEIDTNNLPNLDNQEGVKCGIYNPVTVNVSCQDGKVYECRSYQLCKLPDKIPPSSPAPEDRKPSLAYIKIIWEGATESKLPSDYIDRLKQIEHNDWDEAVLHKLMLIKKEY